MNKELKAGTEVDSTTKVDITSVRQPCTKPTVNGSLLSPPIEIWVNVYNAIKPNSWDIHFTENGAVKNSIGQHIAINTRV